MSADSGHYRVCAKGGIGDDGLEDVKAEITIEQLRDE